MPVRRWPDAALRAATSTDPRAGTDRAPSRGGTTDMNLTPSNDPGEDHGGVPSYPQAQATIAIDPDKLSQKYAQFEEGSRKIRWDAAGPIQLDWSLFDRSKLTLGDLFVVKLVTFVESYADVYTKLLLDNFCADDTMATFFRLWEREEQNHADQLVAYLYHVGLDPDELQASLQRPRQNKFDVPYIKTPLQASAFTYCQELLTAFFYTMFRRTVKEPLLNALLTMRLA